MTTKVDDRIVRAADAIREVYRYSPTGGNLHIAIDDGNLDFGNLEHCREFIADNLAGSSRRALKAEREALEHLVELREDEREAACELAHGREPYPDESEDEEDQQEEGPSVDRAIDRIRGGETIDRDDFVVLWDGGYILGSEVDRTQSLALIDAGWTPEPPTGGAGGDPYPWDRAMSWAWRRPPRQPGKPGRRFASTEQAYNAMVRERKERL